jgi:hypothetical protein
MSEVWKEFGNLYRVSESGIVQSRFSGEWKDKKLKKSKTDQNGGFYLTFSFGRRHVRLHIFMWEMFKGPRKAGHVINHIDGDRTNCAIWNLEEVTQKENIQNLIQRGKFRGYYKKDSNKVDGSLDIRGERGCESIRGRQDVQDGSYCSPDEVEVPAHDSARTED